MKNSHLDPDTLAAFAEQSLSAEHRAGVFLHLANCAVCRDYLSVYSGLKMQCAGNTRSNWLPPLSIAAAFALAVLAGWFVLRSPAPVPDNPLYQFSTQPRLANVYRQVTLARFSFAPDKRWPSAPRGNQITVMTGLGERWITIKGNWDIPAGRSRN